MAREIDGVFINEGAVFSLPLPQELVIGFSLAVLAATILLLLRTHSWRSRGPLLLILAGGVGNLAQRVRYGGVHDPFQLGTAAFNLFDLLIGVGCIWLLVILWRLTKQVD